MARLISRARCVRLLSINRSTCAHYLFAKHGCVHVQPTLLDRYDYGMYGKVFQYDHEGGNMVAIYASFGGLLMCLRGEQRHLHMIHNDTRIYCLLRKQ